MTETCLLPIKEDASLRNMEDPEPEQDTRNLTDEPNTLS